MYALIALGYTMVYGVLEFINFAHSEVFMISAFVGVDERAYPRDFAVFVRYHDDLLRKIDARYAPPPPLSLAELEHFLNETHGRYQAEWN